MALSEKRSSHAGLKADGALIKTVTENGFTIVRACAPERAEPGAAIIYCFVVEDPEGMEHDVTVEFSAEANALIRRRRRQPLSDKSSFWISCAERSLATYLWEQQSLPPSGRLIIEDVCLEDLETAMCWNSD